MRPVHHGYIKYSELKDGSVTLEDLAIMNNNIDVELHNKSVAHQIANQK